jgi:hypothetical protein
MQRLIFLALAALAPGLIAEDASTLAIRVLRDECISCHKPGKAKGGLILTNHAKLLEGGDSGPSITVGKGSQSLLHEVLLKDGDPHMPPKKQLPEASISAVKQWIDSGAAWRPEVFDELPAVSPVQVAKAPASFQPALAMALRPDQKKLAVSRGTSLLIYDLEQAERPLEQRIEAHPDAIQSLAWSTDGQWLATGAFRSVKVWDATAWRQIKSLSTNLIGPITAMTFAGEQLIVADGVQTQSAFLHRIDALAGKLLSTWKVHEDSIYGMALSPDGKLLATGSADRLIKLWNPADGKFIGSLEGHVGQVSSIAFSGKGDQLVSASADKEVKVWDVKDREQVILLGEKKEAASALAWSSDDSTVVAATERGHAWAFTKLQKHTGAERPEAASTKKLPSIEGAIHSLVILKDGKTAFAATSSGLVHIWDTGGKLLGQLKEPGAK